MKETTSCSCSPLNIVGWRISYSQPCRSQRYHCVFTALQISRHALSPKYSACVLGDWLKKGVQSLGRDIQFIVTDLIEEVPVRYGILPDLFREGKVLLPRPFSKSGTFIAENVLAKHDENYMPAEVMGLKQSDQWIL